MQHPVRGAGGTDRERDDRYRQTVPGMGMALRRLGLDYQRA